MYEYYPILVLSKLRANVSAVTGWMITHAHIKINHTHSSYKNKTNADIACPPKLVCISLQLNMGKGKDARQLRCLRKLSSFSLRDRFTFPSVFPPPLLSFLICFPDYISRSLTSQLLGLKVPRALSAVFSKEELTPQNSCHESNLHLLSADRSSTLHLPRLI